MQAAAVELLRRACGSWLLVSCGLLGIACHEAPPGLDLDVSSREPLAAAWIVDELCAEGVFILNRAADARLSVKDVTQHGGPQVTELSSADDGTFRDVWQLILIDVDQGVYRIQNVRPPHNFLTSELDARGADINSVPDELFWLLRKAPTTDEADAAWFEFIPMTAPERRLAARSDSSNELDWFSPAPEDTGVPARAQWALERIALCGLER